MNPIGISGATGIGISGAPLSGFQAHGKGLNPCHGSPIGARNFSNRKNLTFLMRGSGSRAPGGGAAFRNASTRGSQIVNWCGHLIRSPGAPT
jgi:hypothetical protein